MQPANFQRGMDRLSETFGAYKRERMQLIWLEVKDVPDEWFEKLCSELIGSERQAPLIDRFREEVAKLREQSWRQQKQVYKEEAKVWSSRFGAEDLQMICGAIRRRMSGGMPDADWHSFLKLLKITATECQKFSCERCSESGIVFRREGDYEFAYRCVCRFGDRYPKLTLNMGY